MMPYFIGVQCTWFIGRLHMISKIESLAGQILAPLHGLLHQLAHSDIPEVKQTTSTAAESNYERRILAGTFRKSLFVHKKNHDSACSVLNGIKHFLYESGTDLEEV
jgi:hypothetical protein